MRKRMKMKRWISSSRLVSSLRFTFALPDRPFYSTTTCSRRWMYSSVSKSTKVWVLNTQHRAEQNRTEQKEKKKRAWDLNRVESTNNVNRKKERRWSETAGIIGEFNLQWSLEFCWNFLFFAKAWFQVPSRVIEVKLIYRTQWDFFHWCIEKTSRLIVITRLLVTFWWGNLNTKPNSDHQFRFYLLMLFLRRSWKMSADICSDRSFSSSHAKSFTIWWEDNESSNPSVSASRKQSFDKEKTVQKEQFSSPTFVPRGSWMKIDQQCNYCLGEIIGDFDL